jgi:hypothetical protein
VGTIHRLLHEVTAALAPAEDDLVDTRRSGGLLYTYDLSWPEGGQVLIMGVRLYPLLTLRGGP